MLLDKFGKEIKPDSILLIPIVGSIYIGKAAETEASIEGLFGVNYVCDRFEEAVWEVKETYSYPERCIVVDESILTENYKKLLKGI